MTHQVSGPKAHARVDYHTFGASDEKPVCCGLNVSNSCGTTRTYNGASRWTCT